MKKKTLALVGTALMFCFYFGILFTMSSKNKNLPDPDPDNCDVANVTRQIIINFQNPNQANQYRKANFQGHIPSQDLRYGTTPGELLTVKNKWYCKIYIKSPQCSEFLYQWVLETGNNVVNVNLPGDADFNISVSYYETFDAPNNAFDFNKDDTGELFCIGYSTRVKWYASQYFPGAWNNGVAQPITLSPSDHLCELNPFNPNKGMRTSDYQTANDFIEDTNPNI